MDALIAASRRYISFDDLAVGEYKVNKFSFVESTYGRRIRVELDDGYMFLPRRYMDLVTNKDMQHLNKTAPKIMKYDGKDVEQKNMLLISFRDIENADNEKI